MDARRLKVTNVTDNPAASLHRAKEWSNVSLVLVLVCSSSTTPPPRSARSPQNICSQINHRLAVVIVYIILCVHQYTYVEQPEAHREHLVEYNPPSCEITHYEQNKEVQTELERQTPGVVPDWNVFVVAQEVCGNRTRESEKNCPSGKEEPKNGGEFEAELLLFDLEQN